MKYMQPLSKLYHLKWISVQKSKQSIKYKYIIVIKENTLYSFDSSMLSNPKYGLDFSVRGTPTSYKMITKTIKER